MFSDRSHVVANEKSISQNSTSFMKIIEFSETNSGKMLYLKKLRMLNYSCL